MSGENPTPVRLPAGRLALGWVVLAGLMLAMSASLVHAFKMVRTKGPELSDRLEDAITERVVIPAKRGEILDRNGRPLAVSELVFSCFFDPDAHFKRRARNRDKADQVLVDLAAALNMPPADLWRRIAPRPDSDGEARPKRFVWLKRFLPDAERRAVEAVKEKHKAGELGLRKESRRLYPQGPVASQILGFVSMDGAQEGVEKYWDAWLREEDGYFYRKVDAAGRPLEGVPEETRPPRDGRTVVLTIDVNIQRKAEEVLAEACRQYEVPSGSAIVLDCKTGEVLALANHPSYDPNDPGKADAESRKNRALTDPYEPGSTFKVFTSAAALEAGVTRLGDPINCHGGLFVYKGRRLHDHHSYGTLTFEQSVAKSSNIAMAQLALRLGEDDLHAALTRFGFGRPTGLGLPGESRGLLYPVNRWSGTSILSIAMGQECAVTPMQLVGGFAAIANGGTLLRPRLVQKIQRVGPDFEQTELDLSAPVALGRPMSAATARTLIDPVLTMVVQEGTGTKAKLEGYGLFGKTGTAQISKRGGGYEQNLYVGSFIAAGPTRDPRVVVMVNLNRVDKTKGHYYGGTVAAPPVKAIFEYVLPYLKVPPDPPAAEERGPRRPGR